MLERFSVNARRIIFFANYEAGNLGSPYVEPEHLLLGLLRQDTQLAGYLLRSLASIRDKIEARRNAVAKPPQSSDLPLSAASQRVLANAAIVAENRSEMVDNAHIFIGLRREEKSFAAELISEALQNTDRRSPPRSKR